MTSLAAHIDACIPDDVRRVCEDLAAAGHAAVVVGGAVRDAIMRHGGGGGRDAADWDVATDATPTVVQRLFPRTIPTGVAHGTVTVLAGRQRRAVEVTTFRGEGSYLDGRHPSSVTFGVPLHEDLARRDITINAIAFDLATKQVVDPFGGVPDIAAGVIRAVGDPVARLTEDGLRVMRVVRFAATLGFAIDDATEQALTVALPSLAKVAGERIKVELWKLLGARCVVPTLRRMKAHGISRLVAPEWAAVDVSALAAALDPQASDEAGAYGASEAIGAMERLAILVAAASPTTAHAERAATEMALRWRCSTQEKQAIAAVARGLVQSASMPVADASSGAAWLAAVGRAHVPLFQATLGAWQRSHPGAAQASDLMHRLLGEGVALSVGELPLGGEALMAMSGRPAGPWIGQTLKSMLAWTWEAPGERTNANALQAQARRQLGV